VPVTSIVSPRSPLFETEHLTTMSASEIKNAWDITKRKLKQKWSTLTDDDLYYAEGEHEELVGRIQKRTGEPREVVEKAFMESSSLGSE